MYQLSPNNPLGALPGSEVVKGHMYIHKVDLTNFKSMDGLDHAFVCPQSRLRAPYSLADTFIPAQRLAQRAALAKQNGYWYA